MVWTKIAASLHELSFNESGLLELVVKGKTICLSLQGEMLNACAYTCPHAGGRLADGHIDASGNIVCPLHRYKFSLSNGRNTSGEGYYLKTYAVKVEADGIYLAIPQNNLFDFSK